MTSSIKKRDALIVAPLFIIIFLAQYLIALKWSSLGIFSQYNIIFDSDPNQTSAIIAHGWNSGGFNHPLLGYYFSIPLRALSYLLDLTGLIEDPEKLRSTLTLFLLPLFTAMKAALIYFSFRLLKLKPAVALIAASISALGFSSIVFGSTPSTYGISSFGLALSLFTALLVKYKPSKASYLSFISSAIFVVGVTSSNIIYIGWLIWFLYRDKEGQPFWFSLMKAVKWSSIILIATLLLSSLFSTLKNINSDASQKITTASPSTSFIQKYTPSFDNQINNIIRFPEIVTRTFIPSIPDTKKNILAIKNDDPIKVELAYLTKPTEAISIVLSLISIGVIIGGFLVTWNTKPWNNLLLASLASIMTFGALYSLFGLNTYLYSQVWSVPCILIIGALASRIRSYKGYFIATSVLILMLAGNIYVIEHITGMLT
ncbi:hypothetical protein [Neptunomonas sp. XY-337]|uniref:hypothetical protein n=1 Tax=Neptunomonas sp. XY-337 TaxID=2561897 RepID=UPI0010A9AB13|nr:hypothetical protein [Neptunomonas sp. XY-337]